MWTEFPSLKRHLLNKHTADAESAPPLAADTARRIVCNGNTQTTPQAEVILFIWSYSGEYSGQYFCFKGPILEIPNSSNTDALGREFGPPPAESVSI